MKEVYHESGERILWKEKSKEIKRGEGGKNKDRKRVIMREVREY